jgi:hypothetical protein
MGNNWVDYVNEVDQSTVEQQGVRYPYIQWVNGNPQLKALGGVPAMGGWFMPAEQAPNDEMQGWIKNVLTHSTGAETEGWFREVLTFAPIRSRRCWRVNATGRSQMYPWNQYDEALKAGHPAGKLQVLAIVKEWPETPVILTMSGMVAKAFAPARQGESVMGAFRSLVLTPANKLSAKHGSKNVWPWYAFWLTVQSTRDAKGAPVYDTVGTPPNDSKITPPMAVGLHKDMTEDDLGKLFVGQTILKAAELMYSEAETWAQAWETMQAQSQPEAVAAVVGENGEEEIPF